MTQTMQQVFKNHSYSQNQGFSEISGNTLQDFFKDLRVRVREEKKEQKEQALRDVPEIGKKARIPIK